MLKKICRIEKKYINLLNFLKSKSLFKSLKNIDLNCKKYITMGINANKKVKRKKVRVTGNKNSTNNWGITAAGWNAVHKAIINAE